jgi:hypothetical protein
MGLRADGYVGPVNIPDGDAHNQPLRLGNGGEILLTQNHGKYFEAATRGNLFVATSATPINIPVDTALSTFPTLWNPSGSGVALEIVRVSLTQSAATPAAPGALEWFFAKRAGNAIGTLGPMTVFTNIPPVNLLLGGGRISKARYAQAVTWTIGQRPIYLMGTGVTQDTWAAASTNPVWSINIDFEGMLVVPPDAALCLVATVATATTYFVSIVFQENPLTGVAMGY